ncbi:Uncharacterised protein family (UPF0180) [Caldanaerovirga acetigignens]|uniref:Uncharacterized protein family (UPF0180) n=1 Tax=Caldanaerovirga acetigignens TaxID=447595 RepID=A0A1M7GND1_9FIRM|nr:YkuS family protein [Caldanaerovirga acetigignens]SHM17904.1 Uncharacterised protein family (UPF0180) [Caldanaerovirga acetigignens]
MKRIIAVEDGLEDLIEYLRARGFVAMPWNEAVGEVDAVIYRGRKLKEMASLSIENMMDNMGGNSFGVLLVNAEGRTNEQIYEIIKNRIYDHFI